MFAVTLFIMNWGTVYNYPCKPHVSELSVLVMPYSKSYPISPISPPHPPASLNMHVFQCNVTHTARACHSRPSHCPNHSAVFSCHYLRLTSCYEDIMTFSDLPIHKWIILAPIVLDLEHPNTWNIPLEVKLDQCGWWCGLSGHHSLFYPTLHIAGHVASVVYTSGGCGNVRWSRVRLLDVVGVVGDVWKFNDNQVYGLVSLTSWIGGDAGERACVFYSTDDDVQTSISINQCPRGVWN